jgi:hypothetical protein
MMARPRSSRKHIRLHKLERVVRLRFDIHTNDVGEPGLPIAHSGSAGTAEKVEESHSDPPIFQ